VDTVGGRRTLDNMEERALHETTGWTEAANVLDVAADAASVHFGVLLAGAGAVDLAAPRFEAVSGDVPVTKAPVRPLAAEPQGLDFGAA
jgi:hypothetical protein